MLPNISVIVPFRDVFSIKRCIETLLAIDYPYEKLEIIAAGNPEAALPAHLTGLCRVRFVGRKGGDYSVRNAAVHESSGDVVVFIESDCTPDAEWLSHGVDHLKESGVGAVAGRIERAPARTPIEEYEAASGVCDTKAAFRHSFLPYALSANAFYRRDVFQKLGGFEETWAGGGDADLSWRMQASKWKLVYADDAVVTRRPAPTPESIEARHRRDAHGACLLNERYHSQFEPIHEPIDARSLSIKIGYNEAKREAAKAAAAIACSKAATFYYLSRVARVGRLQGYLDYANDRQSIRLEPERRRRFALSPMTQEGAHA